MWLGLCLRTIAQILANILIFFEIHSPEFWRQKQRRHLYTYFKPSHVLSLFPKTLSDMTIAAVPVENGKVT